MNSQQVGLRRALSLPLVTFYGLGTILGAGIYVLVGEVAGAAGMYAPLAFLVAALVASFTAFTYAELSARHPLSGAEAVYVQEGLGRRELSTLVGLLIVFSGLVSSATLANGFVGYLGVFFELPEILVICVVVLVLGVLAFWGILESVSVAAVATIIEIAGLILIIAVSGSSFADLPERLPELIPPLKSNAWWGIAMGAFLAFYAFIGFEDMVNVSEEVKDPQRTMPRAIILALVASTVLYFLVVTVAVLALPVSALLQSDAPLALLFEHATGTRPTVIALISLFAVINGALIQMIMASRMLYGMGRAGWLFRSLGKVSERTRTPVVATVTITIGVLLFALWLPLVTLAKLTSFAILLVFVLVNLSLIRIKQIQQAPAGIRVYPLWVPYGGMLLAVLLLVFQTLSTFGVSA
ncbi:MAG: amino acid permease [Betaproteobacteria bacterium]|nr:MAG: amino acid permease [Betaproteobacteria bacterium]